MKKKRWCWNFDDHGLRKQETKKNNRNLTHIVVRYEAIQNIKKPGGATVIFELQTRIKDNLHQFKRKPDEEKESYNQKSLFMWSSPLVDPDDEIRKKSLNICKNNI